MTILDSLAVTSAVQLMLAVSLLGSPDPKADAAAVPPSNPTPEQAVEQIISDAARFPAAGDDLTMYIDGRFDQAERGATRRGF
jgi:hypothetical protein